MLKFIASSTIAEYHRKELWKHINRQQCDISFLLFFFFFSEIETYFIRHTYVEMKVKVWQVQDMYMLYLVCST